jgi:enoyl-CoA hydratase/carnithine racemase
LFTYLVVFCEYSSILSAMSSEPAVKLSISGDGIATITLSRPSAANALNSQMALELQHIFTTLANNIRVAILTGEGEKAFCAGADLKERQGMDTESWKIQHQQFRKSLKSIMDCPVPVIAAVSGAAYGGGLELALGCDFIYASDTARFAFPEVTLGIMPGMGGTQNLPRAIGLRRAKELLLTGKPFSAQEAYGWGLVNKICSPQALMDEAVSCARAIASAAPLSVNTIKLATGKTHLPIDEALFAESEYYKHLLPSDDRKEGISAFNEKRKPHFSGK